MCEAAAYILDEDGNETLVLDMVDTVIPEGDKLVLTDIFGQQKIVSARIKEMALVSHRIVMERADKIAGNATLEAIAERCSCRAFTDACPQDAAVLAVAKAAVQSPSGMNRQGWRVIVLKNRTLMDEMEAEALKNLEAVDKTAYERIMSRGGKLFYNAPMMMVLPISPAVPKGAELIDLGILCENIAISATAVGLASLICGLAVFAFAGDKREDFSKRLGFPEGFEIGAAVLLGTADGEWRPHEPDMSKISFVE